MTDTETIRVEVAYALPEEQKIIALDVASGTTAFDAVQQSGIARQFKALDVENSGMGIFGKAVKSRDYVLKAGDRVEIYRPLTADPKEVRKKERQWRKQKRKQPIDPAGSLGRLSGHCDRSRSVYARTDF
jgi:putative ubiquitin-RnfH superfamily antitoxin RatB of RatAB toxin-antitoxin module